MTRLSCSFCILASRQDLRRAAVLRPDLYKRYASLERKLGHTLSPSRLPLPQITGIAVPSDHSADFPETPDLQPLHSLEAGR